VHTSWTVLSTSYFQRTDVRETQLLIWPGRKWVLSRTGGRAIAALRERLALLKGNYHENPLRQAPRPHEKWAWQKIDHTSAEQTTTGCAIFLTRSEHDLIELWAEGLTDGSTW
jgi:hypothetical protein